ncbi:hypothetical protein COOONC_10021 [Cooperia oncophora]
MLVKTVSTRRLFPVKVFLIWESQKATKLVRQRLEHLAHEKAALLALWEERRILYEQCMDLSCFIVTPNKLRHG